MKLLHCINCDDIRRMFPGDWVSCSCGKTRGRYVDELHAVIDGDYAVAIGISNKSLDSAIEQHLTNEEKDLNVKEGPRLEAWVIPHKAPTVGRPFPCPCGKVPLVTAPQEPVACPCGRGLLDISLVGGMHMRRWIPRRND